MILKKLVKDFIPPIIIKIYYKFLKQSTVVDRHEEGVSTFVEEFNFNLTESSIIMANGPSLKEFFKNHFDFIRGKTVFAINSFADSNYFVKVKPSFYVFADPNYWAKDLSIIMKQSIESTYNNMLEKVEWPMFIFLPISARSWNSFIDLPTKNNNIKLVYFNNARSIEKNSIKRWEIYKSNRAMIPAQTVTIAAINLSLNFGFKKNFVLGADMSMHEKIHVDKHNVVCIVESHFYEKESYKEHPFWKDSANKETFTMEESFIAFSRMFRGFMELEKYSRFLKAKVYNIGEASYIDAFERINL